MPWVMPQQDPDSHTRCLMTYNRPEFIRQPVRVSPTELARAMNSAASQVTGTTPATTGGIQVVQWLYFRTIYRQQECRRPAPWDIRPARGLQAAEKPLNPWPKGGLPTDTGAADYDTNVVYITLNNGNRQRVSYDTGVHPWRNQYHLGPVNWVADASLLKFINLNEKLRLRLNLDLFNLFNRPGYIAPASGGILSLGFSYIANGFRPRQLQGILRLEW